MGTLKELLTTPDVIRITTPVLPREKLERVLEMIRSDVAAEKIKIDNPTQNLESYFLDVVQKARDTATETSGATSGHKVAAYLRGDGETTAREKILERLAAPATQSAPAPGPATAPAVDDAKLGELTRAKSSPTPAPEPTRAVDLSEANEKLRALTEKKQ
jgi:hypothetical protein